MSEYLISGRPPKPGQDVPVKVDIVSGTITGSNGAILDGVDSAIKASVLDYTSSNPLAVRLSDTNGDYVAAGAGTQYTEDAVAAANPVGSAIIVVRDDARGGSLTTLDGDNVALRGTNAGELYVKHVDTIAATQSGTWNVTNVSGTVSLPTGASTAAKQDTGNTSLSTIAGAVSGTEMQVDVLTMPTVTVNAHAVTNAGTFAVQENGAALTALQLIDDAVFAEDVAAQAADKGVAVLAVRRDADTSLVGTDNDYANLQVNATGALKVEIFDGGDSHTIDGTVAVSAVGGTVAVTQSGTWDEVGINDSGNSITVDNGGTFAVQVDGAALTSLQLIDDPVAVLGTATYTEAATKGMIIGAIRRDADTTLVDTTNEVSPLQVDANGRLKVEAFSGETLPVSLTSTTVTGTVAVTQSGTWDEVGINDSGNSITVDNAALSVTGGGVEATALRVTIASDSTGVLSVDDNGGALTVDGTVSISGTVAVTQSGTWDEVGIHDSGNSITVDGTVTAVHGITGIGHGVTTVTTAGTDVALAASTACKRVVIQSQTDNTTGIAVGGSGVDATIATGTGIFLYPGDVIELEIDNLADVFIDSLTNGEGVRYTYFT